MLKRFRIALILAVLFAVGFGGVAIARSTPQLFTSVSAAQRHCPHDTVVWLNIPSGVYHYQGERWFGRTKDGAFVCEKEAIAAGDRASRNGQ